MMEVEVPGPTLTEPMEVEVPDLDIGSSMFDGLASLPTPSDGEYEPPVPMWFLDGRFSRYPVHGRLP